MIAAGRFAVFFVVVGAGVLLLVVVVLLLWSWPSSSLKKTFELVLSCDKVVDTISVS